MGAVFKYELDNNEITEVRKFCDRIDYCSIEQSLGWTKIFYRSKICYFMLMDEKGLSSFCQINESYKNAHIFFGPVCCDKELMVTSVNEIINYYKSKGFYYLDIQMYYKTCYDTDYVEYKLNKQHKIRTRFNQESTKSSIEIDLTESVDEINSHIRKGHWSDIKKALKLGIKVDVVHDADDLIAFSDVYTKMCRVRKLDEGELSAAIMNAVQKYLTENKKGQILIVKDNLGKVLGGVILVYQGLTVRFYKGTSDPDRRDVPILHLALYEAIMRAKAENFRFFDFWGFNHFAKEGDQIYNINKFKKGFGGYYTFFAKKMHIDLVPFGSYLFKLLLAVRKIKYRVSSLIRISQRPESSN